MSGTGNGGGDATGGNTGGGCCSAIVKKLGLRPITRCNLAKFYVPAYGAVSYTAMSVNVMNPLLYIKIFPKKDVTNVLLIGSLVGIGSYIYTRKHMKPAPEQVKLAYSTTGAILFSLGSVLLWAVIRTIMPPNSAYLTATGIVSAVGLLGSGHSYLMFVDRQVAKKRRSIF